MKLQTKYFGEIHYESGDCLHFPSGLFGFESEHEFLLLPFAGSENAMLCLQSVATPALAFIAMDPFALSPDYAPMLQPAELEDLGVGESQALNYYVLCVVKKPVSDSTVNLKCPIAVNLETRNARQVILDTNAYEMRHPLADFSRKEDGSTC